MHHRTDIRRPSGLCALLILWPLAGALLGAGAGCGGKKAPARRSAPTQGVVGQVTALRGEVTWSQASAAQRTPLRVGDAIHAEWTVHTAPGALLTVRLRNGHLWTLAGDLSKRVATVQALTLPPVREGALTQVADLGSRTGKDRTAAAGLYHEMAVGTQAAPTRGDQLELDEGGAPDQEKDADPPPTTGKLGVKGFDDTRRATSRARRTTRKAAPGKAPPAPMRKAALDGLFESGPLSYKAGRGGGGGKSSAGQGRLRRAGMGSAARRASGSSARTQRQEPVASPPPPPPSSEPPSDARTRAERSRTQGAEKAANTQPPKRPAPAAVLAALAPHRARLGALLRQQGLSGRQRVKLLVDGTTGRVQTVWVTGKPAGHAVCVALQRVLRTVSLPRATGLYTQDIVLDAK